MNALPIYIPRTHLASVTILLFHQYLVVKNILERISFAARKSEFIDPKSGVSARMSITAMENLYSTAERRAILNGEKKTMVRIADFWGVIPSITGKVELVYEGLLPISLHHSTKLTPGIRPLTAGTPALGKSR